MHHEMKEGLGKIMPAAVMDALASAAGTQTGHWQKN